MMIILSQIKISALHVDPTDILVLSKVIAIMGNACALKDYKSVHQVNVSLVILIVCPFLWNL